MGVGSRGWPSITLCWGLERTCGLQLPRPHICEVGTTIITYRASEECVT